MAVNESTERSEAQVSQSYWALVWWRFKKNRLAVIGGLIVIAFYFVCVITPQFWSPYLLEHKSEYNEARPQFPVFRNAEGNFSLRPHVYGLTKEIDEELRKRVYTVDKSRVYPLYFLVRRPDQAYYPLPNVEMNLHLFGTHPDDPEATAFILGTDKQGRDIFSRIIYGGRLSLMIGLIGVFLTLFFGATLGAASGYYGGGIDMFVQRTTEFLQAFPDIPLFMALAAAIPVNWSPILIYFMLTIILSFRNWGGLARQVRGLVLSIREREYVLAAESFGAPDQRIIFRHLLPGTLSHIIVILTLMIPGMILTETALSWLGLGLRPPLTSWGVLMQEVSSVRAIRFAPWLLSPVPFVLLAILGFNMLGDGLRDAMDPYGGR